MSRPATPAVPRIWSKTTQDGSGCWLYQGGLSNRGYAQVWENGTNRLAHRVMYLAILGPIPDGLQLDHLCRVRHCVNPWHLEPVTARENVLRGVGITAEHARRTHCISGHLLDDSRRCKPCRARRQREYTARRNAVA